MSDRQYSTHADGGLLFEGWNPRECGEHRTVGAHRAWCYDCTTWCYPAEESACPGCRVPALEAAVTHAEDEIDARLDAAFNDGYARNAAALADVQDKLERLQADDSTMDAWVRQAEQERDMWKAAATQAEVAKDAWVKQYLAMEQRAKDAELRESTLRQDVENGDRTNQNTIREWADALAETERLREELTAVTAQRDDERRLSRTYAKRVAAVENVITPAMLDGRHVNPWDIRRALESENNTKEEGQTDD
jgi:hypothetical protein